MQIEKTYDVIVIGGGHAGCEAALASARRGCRTLLVSLHADRIAAMSCNPAIGGQGKGQLVKELDAMGGEMGVNADLTGIHFRLLNTSKGPAVHSSRSQNDRFLYAKRMQSILRRTENLTIVEAEVSAIRESSGTIEGVVLNNDCFVGATCVVVTAGTFMRGLLHFGMETQEGGRVGDKSARTLSQSLEEFGFSLCRLKTGTPARVDRRSLDFSQFAVQPGDVPPRLFSHWGTHVALPQVNCYIAYTNERTHEVIRSNFEKSPLYSGKIVGRGPRYCPSIEDKVIRFSDRTQHHVFVEPEGLTTDRMYPNGLSTSLPPQVQEDFLRTMKGFERCVIIQPGYAVEYDAIDPRELTPTLEAKKIKNLFLAGQVNGTSGYEEAAAQGFVAGINAVQLVYNAEHITFDRKNSYTGVMLDDLTRLGADEPYRMFTARCEYRLLVREDNAVERLGGLGVEMGLVSKRAYDGFMKDVKDKMFHVEHLQKARVASSDVEPMLKGAGYDSFEGHLSLYQLLKRPGVSFESIAQVYEKASGQKASPSLWKAIEVSVKYEGYIQRQEKDVERQSEMAEARIPGSLDYSSMSGMSLELREKLKRFAPKNFAEAARIPGMTPSGLAVLAIGVRKASEEDSFAQSPVL